MPNDQHQAMIHYPTYSIHPIPITPTYCEIGWWVYYPVPYHPYHHPEFSINDAEVLNFDNSMITRENSRASELNSDECTVKVSSENFFSENSDLYLGVSHQPKNEATELIQEEEEQQKEEEEQQQEEEDESSEEEEEEEEDSRCSVSNKNNISSESSDSESYLAYSTGLNPLKNHRSSSSSSSSSSEINSKADDDATDCEKDLEDGIDDTTTVCVSLPLRIKAPNKDTTTTTMTTTTTPIVDVETCVDFTLRRVSVPNKQDETINTPLVTITHETNTEDRSVNDEETLNQQDKTLLTVDLSKKEQEETEEVTDDEDSGVTSDMSRIISEVDTDSENNCCQLLPPVVKRRTTNKYQRTQTHSRLFRLLSDDQLLKPPTTTTTSDLSLNKDHLPINRPKSLDCEALLNKNEDYYQNDLYYRTWKNARNSSAIHQSTTYPARRVVNVACPRVLTPKNQQQSRIINTNNKSLILGSTSRSRINQRC